MLFESAIHRVINARVGYRPGSNVDLTEVQPTYYSIQHLDFTRGETSRAIIFSGPVSAFLSLEHFVACGIDILLKELGYEHHVSPDEDEAISELSRLRFEPAHETKVQTLKEHLFHPDIEHDLSYYDHPKVKRLAHIPPWIFPASGGLILTSKEIHFLYYWYCTG